VNSLNHSGVKNLRIKSYLACGSLRLGDEEKVTPNRQFNLTYFSPKIEKRISPIQGRGLFAKADIEKGEVVVVKGGYVLTKNQRDEIGRELGPSEIQITEHLFIGPTSENEREGGMMHLNHCCEPNLGLQGKIVFVAHRDKLICLWA